MSVIDMNEFRKNRPAQQEGYDGAVCLHCGEAWFRIGGEGAVCLGPDGTVTGYAGYLYCSSCGRPFRSP